MPQPAAGADRRATAAFVTVLLLSLVVLFSPRTPSEQGIPHLDKVVHATLFALLAATTWWRFPAHRLGLLAVLVYAGLSEVVQATVVTSRDGDVRDFSANVLGVLVGWYLARRWSIRRPAAREG